MPGAETTRPPVSTAPAGTAHAPAPVRRRLLTQKRQVGRYDYTCHGPRADTRSPEGGVGRAQHPTRRRETALGAVVDPWGNGRERIEVAIDRKVDMLEWERSHKLISEAAYRTGRIVQAIFERSGRLGSTNWAGTSRMDPILVQETNMMRALDAAERIKRTEARITARLGMIDTRLLRRILGDRLSYAECAGLQGKSGERGQSYIAQRFREALEDLADMYAAKGDARPAPDDGYKSEAETVPRRQVAAIVGGASRRRYGGELRAARAAATTAPTPRERRLAAEEADGLEKRLAWLGGEGE